MGILCWSLVRETPRCLRPSLLPVWQQLLLLSLRLSPRLLLIPTFCMADMVDMVVMDMDTVDTMASVKLRLSPRLLLIPTFCMAVMDMDTVDTMASVRLRLNPRLLLIPTFCMADMAVILDMLVLDMPDTDTLMVLDMPTTDKLYLTPTSKWTAKHTNILVSLFSDHISVLDINFGDR